MTQDILNAGGEVDLRTERAQRAVRVFRGMQPGLSGYARAITGRRDVIVELAQGVPRTDGKKIYFKPPMALGDSTPHDRGKCERRDRTTKLQLCPACRVREEVLITICHEIAHIAFGTFEEPTSEAKAKALERAVEESPARFAQRLRESWSMIPDWKKKDVINLSSLVSPFLPVLVNALEDARVDEAMFKARRGTRIMFDAYVNSIFASGIEDDDGNFSKWEDKPLNSQALIGVFVLACKYDYKGWFHPKVEEALGDKRLRELCSRIETVRSAEGSYDLAFPILARLRELGFCRSEQDPEDDEPEQEPDPQEEENENDESDQSESDESGETEGNPEEGGESGQPDEADEAEGGEGPSSSEDDGTGDQSSDSEEQDDSEGGGSSDSDTGDDDSSGQSDGSEYDAESDTDGGAEPSSSGEEKAGNEEESEQSESGNSESPADISDDGAGEAGPDDGAEGSGDPSGESSGDDSGSGGDLSDDQTDSERTPPESEEGSDGGEDQQEGADPSDAGGDPSRQGSGDPDLEEGDRVDTDGGSPDDDGSLEELDEEEDGEPVDTLADEGEGGTQTKNPEYGTAEQVKKDLNVFSKHDVMLTDGVPPEVGSEEAKDDAALERAIIQGMYFEKPSANVTGVREHKFGQPIMEGTHNLSEAWDYSPDIGAYSRRVAQAYGIETDLDIPEQILGPALNEMRRTFSDNKRAKYERHLRSGRINNRVLGKRAWSGDDRLFQKKRTPGKRSYAVLIGIDVSASTTGVNIALAKRAAMAQAELCHRTGLDFAIYAHSAKGAYSWGMGYSDMYLDIYEIKAFNQPWSDGTQEALRQLGPDSENLDGHSIEYYRKMIERHQATDKVILYYSDGKMPAANHDEELEILQREIAYCRQKQITLMGVGIRTDSPRRHGLNTVQVDDDSDIPKVVRHLESALLHNR